jgi:hypothetical protein
MNRFLKRSKKKGPRWPLLDYFSSFRNIPAFVTSKSSIEMATVIAVIGLLQWLVILSHRRPVTDRRISRRGMTQTCGGSQKHLENDDIGWVLRNDFFRRVGNAALSVV